VVLDAAEDALGVDLLAWDLVLHADHQLWASVEVGRVEHVECCADQPVREGVGNAYVATGWLTRMAPTGCAFLDALAVVNGDTTKQMFWRGHSPGEGC